MKDKDVLKLIFEMKYHEHEFTKRKELLSDLKTEEFEEELKEFEKKLVAEYYIKKTKLKDIAEDEGFSYGYVRHKIVDVRKKMLKIINEESFKKDANIEIIKSIEERVEE